MLLLYLVFAALRITNDKTALIPFELRFKSGPVFLKSWIVIWTKTSKEHPILKYQTIGFLHTSKISQIMPGFMLQVNLNANGIYAVHIRCRDLKYLS